MQRFLPLLIALLLAGCDSLGEHASDLASGPASAQRPDGAGPPPGVGPPPGTLPPGAGPPPGTAPVFPASCPCFDADMLVNAPSAPSYTRFNPWWRDDAGSTGWTTQYGDGWPRPEDPYALTTPIARVSLTEGSHACYFHGYTLSDYWAWILTYDEAQGISSTEASVCRQLIYEAVTALSGLTCEGSLCP